MQYMFLCCRPSPSTPWAILPFGMPCRALRVLEGGIKMRNRSNLRCRLRSPMRHADTSGLHRVVPCVGCAPGGIHGSTVENLPRRLVLEPYEGPVVLSYPRLKGYLMVAVCRY